MTNTQSTTPRHLPAYELCAVCYALAVWTNEDGSVTVGLCPTCGHDNRQ